MLVLNTLGTVGVARVNNHDHYFTNGPLRIFIIHPGGGFKYLSFKNPWGDDPI